jgi:hypothetical protein
LTHELAAPSVAALGAMLAGETGAEVVADASALREFDSSALAVLLARSFRFAACRLACASSPGSTACRTCSRPPEGCVPAGQCPFPGAAAVKRRLAP